MVLGIQSADARQVYLAADATLTGRRVGSLPISARTAVYKAISRGLYWPFRQVENGNDRNGRRIRGPIPNLDATLNHAYERLHNPPIHTHRITASSR